MKRPSRGRSLAQIAQYLCVKPNTLKICVEPPKPRKYRYVWRLCWNEELPSLLVVGLIASTADEQKDDPTVGKCIDIAKAKGYGDLIMANMFAAWPTPDHRQTSLGLQVLDLVGPGNDRHICQQAQKVRDKDGTVAIAWGNDGWSRHARVLSLIGDPVMCFGLTRPRDRTTEKAKGKTNAGFPLHASLRGIAAEDVTLQPFK